MPTFDFCSNFHPQPLLPPNTIDDIFTAAGVRTDLPDNEIIEAKAYFANYKVKFPPGFEMYQTATQLNPMLIAAMLEIIPSWVTLFLKETQKSRQALECICEGLSGGQVVTATVLGKPDNMPVTFGQPQPDVFAAGWVVFYDAEGYYGQRQFIFTDRQVFRPDIPRSVGYDTYTMPGFNIVFNP